MLRRWWERYRFPLGWFAAMTTLLLVVQHLANGLDRGQSYALFGGQRLRFYFDGWSQFDGPEYQKIAEQGYFYIVGERSNIVWFPLYPNLMRLAERPIGDYLLAGIVVSLIGGAWALTVYWRWLDQREITGRARLLAFLCIALYPYGWYLYGVVHSDSLFLALLVTSFLLAERKRLVWAGVFGALATATRPTGMALIPAIIVMGFVQDGVLSVPDGAKGLLKRFAVPTTIDRSKVRAATFGPWLVVAGLGSWMLWLWVRWGDPIAFINNQRVYHPGDLPLLKRAFVVAWLNFSDDPLNTLTITGQAIVLTFVVWSIPGVCRRFGFSYGLFLAVLVAIPTFSTEDFMGSGRYLIAAFPAYALLGERLAERPPRLQWAVVATLFCLIVFLAAGFSRSWYLT